MKIIYIIISLPERDYVTVVKESGTKDKSSEESIDDIVEAYKVFKIEKSTSKDLKIQIMCRCCGRSKHGKGAGQCFAFVSWRL